MPKDEPQFSKLASLPPPPAHLDEIAAEKWNEVGPQLVASGVLTAVDLQVLEAYSDAYSRWRQYQAALRGQDAVVEAKIGCYAHPLTKLLDQALRQMRDYGALLGLDPANRSRLSVPAPKGGTRFAALPGSKGRAA